MSSTSHAGQAPYYFVPASSRHPVMASIGLFFVFFGAGQWINGHGWGAYAVAGGLLWVFAILYQWFRDSIAESQGGLYGHKIGLSYRWSMSWFIFSEVMFFGAFFSALWWPGPIRCRLWVAWTTRCCGPTSRRYGPAWPQA